MIKIRIFGFLKILAGLAICSPGPACLAGGATWAALSSQKADKLYAELQETAIYQEAMAYKDEQLKILEEQKETKEITPRRYKTESEYYNSTSYLEDVFYSTEYEGLLKDYTLAKGSVNGAIALATIGTAVMSVVETPLINVLVLSAAGKGAGTLIPEGFKELKTGVKCKNCEEDESNNNAEEEKEVC